MSKSLRWILPLLAGGVAVALWAFAALIMQDPTQLPGPLSVGKALGQISGDMLPLIGVDVGAMVTGFIAAFVLGIATAVALTTYRGLYLALTPWVAIGRMTPLLVLTPIFIVAPLTHFATLVIVTTLICYVPIVAILTPALIATDKVLLDLFRTYRASYWQEICLLRFPYALPHLMRALRRSAILAPLATLLTDFLEGALAGQPGLGQLLADYHDAGNLPAIYALCLGAALTGVALAGAVDACAAWVLAHWHDNEHGHH
ncbi:MAG: ABC transporter permease [Puniceicoccales bacterium]